MSILVTGGAGYIGSHACVELLNAGYGVTVIDNLSNSKEESLKRVSVLEMVAAFEKASGREIPYKIVERRPGDIAKCYADSLKAKKEMGWTATRGIEDMCRDTWRWQRKNPEGY